MYLTLQITVLITVTVMLKISPKVVAICSTELNHCSVIGLNTLHNSSTGTKKKLTEVGFVTLHCTHWCEVFIFRYIYSTAGLCCWKSYLFIQLQQNLAKNVSPQAWIVKTTWTLSLTWSAGDVMKDTREAPDVIFMKSVAIYANN